MVLLQYDKLTVNLELIRRYLEGGISDRQTTDQRRFTYVACISALYASFENFAEQIAFKFSQLFLANVNSVSSAQLESFRRRYVQNASSLLSKGVGSGRYNKLTELEVAKSLASCLDDTNMYSLQMEVVTLHGSNLRWDPFNELFRWAIPDLGDKIRNSDVIRHWGENPENVDGRLLADIIEIELEDLVERRNEVAHRAIPDDILSPERLLAKVDFIEAISLGLVASLAKVLLESSINSGDSVPLGVPAEFLKERRVVIIPSLNTQVSEGDVVWASGGRGARWGTVQEIQIDDQRVSEASAGLEVGLLLDFVAPRRGCLHVWSNPSAELMPPPPGIFAEKGPY